SGGSVASASVIACNSASRPTSCSTPFDPKRKGAGPRGPAPCFPACGLAEVVEAIGGARAGGSGLGRGHGGLALRGVAPAVRGRERDGDRGRCHERAGGSHDAAALDVGEAGGGTHSGLLRRGETKLRPQDPARNCGNPHSLRPGTAHTPAPRGSRV